MPRRCVVTGCSANKSVISKSFFRFPNDEELCKKWIKALCNLELVKICETEGFPYLYKNKFVCCEHFDKKHLRNVNAPNQGLFDGAIPTLNLHLNMDTLISNIKENDTLKQIIETKKNKVKRNTKIKTQTNENTTPILNKTEETQMVEDLDCENIEISDLCKMEKVVNSPDDVPLKQLFGDKTKLQNEKESKHEKVKLKDKQKKKTRKDKSLIANKNKLSENMPLKFEQVFIENENFVLDKIKNEKDNDPLRNKSIKFKKNNNKKIKRKNQRVDKLKTTNRKLQSGKTKKLLKVVVAPKTMDNNDLKITTQGPKKIIKLVVPPKATDGNETNQGPNKIIKVVVPKKTPNGKEINLERDEINKILRLVSAPKAVNGKGIKLITQSAEVNRILKLASVPNGTQMKNIERGNLSKTDVSVNKSIDGKVNKQSGKILRKVLPPVNVRPIKLITHKIDGNTTEVSLSSNQVVEKNSQGPGNCKLANLVAMSELYEDDEETDDFLEDNNDLTTTQTNIQSVADSVHFNDLTTVSEQDVDHITDTSLFDNGSRVDESVESLTKVHNDNVLNDLSSGNNRIDSNLDKGVSKENENNLIAEELCKRIKHVIKQRLGDTNNSSSDSDVDEHASKRNKKKSNKNVKKSKIRKKNCSCDAEYHEKMISMWQEERELKRRLITTQNMAARHKLNNRKLAALVIELRKQIPEKKAPKPEHIIKTILPIDKVKERNPHKYRFTRNLKTFALDLFYSSPLSYTILEKMYFLPSRKTLRNWLVHPKNTESDLQALDETNETVMQENSIESMQEEVEMLPDSISVPEDNIAMVPSGHIVSLDANMGVMDDNIENLQENILLLL